MDDQSTDKAPVGENKRPLISSDLATPIHGVYGLGLQYTLYVSHQNVVHIIHAVITSVSTKHLVQLATG